MAHTANMVGIARTRGIGVISAVVISLTPFQQRIYKDDLANIFFNNKQFAEPAVYTHSTGQTKIYNVIFDDPKVSTKVLADAEFNNLRPQFQISESELLQPITKGDRVVVRAVTHYIEDFASDGVGVTTVFMRLK